MGSTPWRPGAWWPVLALLALMAVFAIYPSISSWHAREQRLFWEEVLRPLRMPHHTEEGFWVGDITENYRFGKISRRLAEADTAPLVSLVPNPVPFHGYYVRVMNSGPSFYDGQPPESFKGMKRSRDNFAILIYPAEPGSDRPSWIMNRLCELRRSGPWIPTFDFPTDRERKDHWAIID